MVVHVLLDLKYGCSIHVKKLYTRTRIVDMVLTDFDSSSNSSSMGLEVYYQRRR